MALNTFKKLQDHVLQTAGMGEARRTLCKEWVNKAHREVCESHAWRELEAVSTITTVAPYTTGTVAISNGAANVTGAGTTFTSGMVGRKLSLGYGKPWFVIDTQTNDTDITIDTSWPFASVTASTYTMYEDVYSLGSDVDRVYLDRVYLYDDEGYQIGRLTHGEFLERSDFPEQSGKPDYFAIIENDASGYLQVQIGPYAPDAVYVIKYHYRKAHTEMTADSDVPLLNESLLETVASGALVRAYELPEFMGTGVREGQEARFNRMLSDKIKNHRRMSPRGVQPRPFGRTGQAGYPFSLPVLDD